MIHESQRTNPLYLPTVAVGIVFAVTAFAYCVMTLSMIQPLSAERVREEGGGLLSVLDRHGTAILVGEIAVLAVLTFTAIGTDEYWQRRAEERKKRHAASQEPEQV